MILYSCSLQTCEGGLWLNIHTHVTIHQLNRGVWCELLAFIPLYKCVFPVACKSLPPPSPRCDNCRGQEPHESAESDEPGV